MIAYVTSIGEVTTNLCMWSLQRNGFDVKLLHNTNSLAQKLLDIYEHAEEDFVRVDADVVVNKKLTPEYVHGLAPESWWLQFQTFDWFKQDITNGGVQFIRKAALKDLRNNILRFQDSDRPETQMYRLDEFNTPRRCTTIQSIVGIHGYKQDNIERVKKQKASRKYYTDFDFELAEALEEL